MNTQPSPPSQRASARPDFLRALYSNNLHAVQEALTDNPGAINEPFWEQKCEPPICAVRVGCPPAIVAELLRRGADAYAVDMHNSKNAVILQWFPARMQA